MAGAKKRIKERAKARRANRTFYDMVVGDGDLAGLSAALDEARKTLNGTRIVTGIESAKKTEMLDIAQRMYDEALAAVEAHRDRIWFEAVPDDEYEALRLAHGDPPEKGLWSFIPALLSKCAVDYDSTADEWADVLAGWSRADRDQIAVAVIEANTKRSSEILEKLSEDPLAYERMTYCGPRGIPYLHFMGGPNEWDPLSRRLAIEWNQRKRSECPDCGTSPLDWADDEKAFQAEMYRCLGCEQLSKIEAQKNEYKGGLRKRLVRRLKRD